MYEQDIDPAILERVERRIREKAKFFRHLSSYVVTNIIVWGIYFMSGNGFSFMHKWAWDSIPWPMFVTFFWGIGIVQEAFKVFGGNAFMDRMRESEIRREIQRQRDLYGADGGSAEKRKRTLSYNEANDEEDDFVPIKRKRSDVHLTDDGEMIIDDQPKTQNRSNLN